MNHTDQTKRPVRITITGTHTDDAGQEDSVSSLSTGFLYEKPASSYVLYDETDQESGIQNQCMLKFGDTFVELTKKGTIQSKMHFEVGESILTPYHTPYGEFHFLISTEHLTITRKDDWIKILCKYSLNTPEGEVLSHCKLIASIKSR